MDLNLLLPEAKVWIRKSSTDELDDEVLQTMQACLLDLKRVGVVNYADDDALIKQAVKLYLKANYGYDEKAEKFAAAYENLKAALSLTDEYTATAGE